MADLPSGYVPAQSGFAVPNIEPARVLEEWNIALKAIASNSASPQEPAIAYPHQFYGDPDQDTVLMRNASNSGYDLAMPLNSPQMFEPTNLGLSANGILRRNTSSFSAQTTGVIQEVRYVLNGVVFSGSGFQPDASTGLDGQALTPYTQALLSSTTAPSGSAGYRMYSAVIASPASKLLNTTPFLTRWFVSWQLAGMVTAPGAWLIMFGIYNTGDSGLNPSSGVKCFPFHVRQISGRTWYPVVFSGGFWLDQFGQPLRNSPLILDVRASYADSGTNSNLQFFHPLQQGGVGGVGSTRSTNTLLRNLNFVIVREVLG